MLFKKKLPLVYPIKIVLVICPTINLPVIILIKTGKFITGKLKKFTCSLPNHKFTSNLPNTQVNL